MLRIEDFEWASVSRYVSYVSQVASLVELDLSGVHNFRAIKGDFGALARKKARVLVTLENNRTKVEAYVESHRDDLGEPELAALRSFYLTYTELIKVVQEQVSRATMMQAITETRAGIFNGERELC